MSKVPGRPGALIGSYLVLYWFSGPRLGRPGPHLLELMIVVALAWLVFRGNRVARMMLIAVSLSGCLIALAGHPSPSDQWHRFVVLAGAAAQVAVLVSRPIYARTRPPDEPVRADAHSMWELPGFRLPLVSVVVGLGVNLLPIYRFQPLPSCPRTGSVAAARPAICLANGNGYPDPYRFGGGAYFSNAHGQLRPAFAVVHQFLIGTFLLDWATVSLVVLIVVYLVWLSFRRDAELRGLTGPVLA